VAEWFPAGGDHATALPHPLEALLNFNVGLKLARMRAILARRAREDTISDKVRLLECDPELGLRIPPAHIARSREELVARTLFFDVGLWAVPREFIDPSGVGYLVLDGVLAREMLLADHTCAELIGEGDVLQPNISPDDKLVRYHVQWRVLEPLHVAILDDQVARALGSWPTVMAAILERAVRRTHRMAVHQALLQLSPVETRLLILLWHLAERWGRVTPEGVAIRLPLSHEMLGHLVGCRRASVTTALARVCESGRLSRRPDGAWVLTGAPPEELAPLRWQARRPADAPASVPSLL
jgi:CRP/FNR family cyclic AMP-dependent transcriptional regulator